eukprot:TRINITY_DN7264_c0_g1_i8.p7 TRINITY_DN7264_c0_g1~~TRINITY_DN7264_c0_g1_i8.p7  ORF type:complete len:117 (-),score=2.91 TRINITY_DN7264_c0_g1_i8:902-1252(-)
MKRPNPQLWELPNYTTGCILQLGQEICIKKVEMFMQTPLCVNYVLRGVGQVGGNIQDAFHERFGQLCGLQVYKVWQQQTIKQTNWAFLLKFDDFAINRKLLLLLIFDLRAITFLHI